MAKQPKARLAEQAYIKRARELRDKTPKKRTRTPWTEFFQAGIGAELETTIPRSSVHSMVYSYGKKLGKRFICSLEEQAGVIRVKLEDVKRRD